jgi:hypothetical protein
MKNLQQCKPTKPFHHRCLHNRLRPVLLLRLFLITALLAYGDESHAQNITGLWKGNFQSNDPKYSAKYPIYLNFLLNADSTYTVYSYSWTTKADGSDTTCVCEATCKFSGKDSLYVEEQYIILPQNPMQGNCLQKMYLRLVVRKKDLELSGKWKTTGSNCEDAGYISFYKKREN